MDTKKLKIRRTPHDHTPNAMSYMGVVRIGSDYHGNPRFMCLKCNEVWTHKKGKKLPQGYWHCPFDCNHDFTVCRADPQNVLWSLYFHSEKFTNRADLWEALHYINDNLYDATCDWFEWEKDRLELLALINDAKVKPGVFGTELARNTMRHYVAHLDRWFENHEANMEKRMHTSMARPPEMSISEHLKGSIIQALNTPAQ